MSDIPTTSPTLLSSVASSSEHARWQEFVALYLPVIEQYVRSRFPWLEADDLVQETFVALVGVLPHYRYEPKVKGCFHNYLIGIVRNLARRRLRQDSRYHQMLAAAREEPMAEESSEKECRQAVFELALQRFLADESVADRNRQIFRQVALAGVSPIEVAEAYGITRNLVDQIKRRAMERLRGYVQELTAVLER